MSETVVVIETVTEVVEVVEPGVQGPAGEGVPAGGAEGEVLAKASATDFDTEWVAQSGGAGADDQTAAEVPFTPAGNLAATDVQAALEELDSEKQAGDADLTTIAGLTPTNDDVLQRKAGAWANRTIAQLLTDLAAAGTTFQPLDSDLTAIAALTTTSFGRGLLELANAAALLSATGVTATSAELNFVDGVTSAIQTQLDGKQPIDSDLTAIAALTTTAFGRGLLELANAAALRAAVDLEPGTDIPTQAAFDDHSARHEEGGADVLAITAGIVDSEAATDGQVLTADGAGAAAWETPAGGGSGEALQRDISQAAHGLAVGDVVMFNGTSWAKAQADSAANAEVVGIVAAVDGTDDFTLHYGGRITGLTGLTAGEVYYLDDDTAGLLTTTEPADVGDISKPLLVADSTTTGFFFNWRGAEVAGASGGADPEDENLIVAMEVFA